jgi:hypothetical protein
MKFPVRMRVDLSRDPVETIGRKPMDIANVVLGDASPMMPDLLK